MTRSARRALGDVLCDDLDYARVPIGEAAERILSLLSEKGWVVVPREPTDAMLNNAAQSPSLRFAAKGIYLAMLAAIDGEGPNAK